MRFTVIARRESRRARWRWPHLGRNRRGQWHILHVRWNGRTIGVDGHPTLASALRALIRAHRTPREWKYATLTAGDQ